MALINFRWPRDLCPQTCDFKRSRNDVAQVSPRTRRTTVIRQGRPLWEASLSWRLPNDARLARLRYILDSLEGFAGSAQIWDFSAPLPDNAGLPEALRTAVYSLSSTAIAGSSTFLISGLPSSSLVAVQGQYVQVGRRLYVAAANVTSNGFGLATIPLAAPIVANTLSGAEVRFGEAACEMRLADQDFPASGRAADFVTVSARFVETVVDYA